MYRNLTIIHTFEEIKQIEIRGAALRFFLFGKPNTTESIKKGRQVVVVCPRVAEVEGVVLTGA